MGGSCPPAIPLCRQPTRSLTHEARLAGGGHLLEGLLQESRVVRVAADPAVVPDARVPGGWTGLSYWRLHGISRTYYSPYSQGDLMRLADEVTGVEGEAWFIFDNTAAGAATGQALDLVARLGARGL